MVIAQFLPFSATNSFHASESNGAGASTVATACLAAGFYVSLFQSVEIAWIQQERGNGQYRQNRTRHKPGAA